MAKPAKASQPSYSMISGMLHKDHWIGREAALRIAPASAARTIRFSLWNPYYNRAYLNNEVAVSLDGRVVFSEKLQPAASAVIEYALAANQPLEVEITSQAVMEPDPMDPRERGIIVRLVQEAPKTAAA
jgi:hypothetical protein